MFHISLVLHFALVLHPQASRVLHVSLVFHVSCVLHFALVLHPQASRVLHVSFVLHVSLVLHSPKSRVVSLLCCMSLLCCIHKPLGYCMSLLSCMSFLSFMSLLCCTNQSLVFHISLVLHVSLVLHSQAPHVSCLSYNRLYKTLQSVHDSTGESLVLTTRVSRFYSTSLSFLQHESLVFTTRVSPLYNTSLSSSQHPMDQCRQNKGVYSTQCRQDRGGGGKSAPLVRLHRAHGGEGLSYRCRRAPPEVIRSMKIIFPPSRALLILKGASDLKGS